MLHGFEEIEVGTEAEVAHMRRLLANGVGTTYDLRAWCSKEALTVVAEECLLRSLADL